MDPRVSVPFQRGLAAIPRVGFIRMRAEAADELRFGSMALNPIIRTMNRTQKREMKESQMEGLKMMEIL